MKNQELIAVLEEKTANLIEDRNNERRFLRQHGYDFDHDILVRGYEHTISALEMAIRELKALESKLNS